jgi:D-alanyl-D-alanine carboxypeptidase
MPAPDRIREAVGALLGEAGVPGAAIAVLRPGAPPLRLGVGFRDPGRRAPMPADARTWSYSLMKTWIAAAAMRLAAHGRLDLDAPMAPAAAPLDPRVTMRHLLGHTAGLGDYGGLPAYHAAVRARLAGPWPRAEFVRRVLPEGPIHPPGRGFAYSNVGYMLASEAVAAAAGMPLGAALDALVFRPAGMVRTEVATALRADLASAWTRHLPEVGPLVDLSRRYHPGWVAHGVAAIDALDAARSLEALFAGRIAPLVRVAAMATPVDVLGAHPVFARAGYGLGLMLDLASPYGVLAGHAGEGPGYTLAAFHAPDVAGRPAAIAVLTNGEAPDLGLRGVLAVAGALAGGR